MRLDISSNHIVYEPRDEVKGSKSCVGLTVYAGVFTAWWSIYIPTIRTKQFHRIHTRHICSSTRKHMRRVAENTGTGSKVALFVLLQLLPQLLNIT